jgi:hypothetical protein
MESTHGGRPIAVGTPSLRLLESAAGEDGVIHPFEESRRSSFPGLSLQGDRRGRKPAAAALKVVLVFGR